jgi:hypothetical protein
MNDIRIASAQATHAAATVHISACNTFDACAIFAVYSGGASIQNYPTASELRALALAALSMADALEEE